ncbi:hypothetical protein [Massilia sp. TS11]|uniref:hypothetical protein n=1 Tax=Massilia sp. TS11 TaxID=2908003 RepID=UPI001EDC2AED|nr:hypothetical protein [Massilia sp. TS11]MCG2583703.1 hypothetical protein [Massilia sp. TS11]
MSSLALSSALQAAPAEACVEPVFPVRSVSPEGVRRVQAAVQRWQSCVALAHGEDGATPAMLAQQERVALAAQAWERETARYMRGLHQSRSLQAYQDRDRASYQAGIRDQYLYGASNNGH